MSELITARTSRADIRLQLLGTASAFVLLAAIATNAKAEDADRPTVWIELGAQVERVQSGQEQFAPPFVLATPRPAPETVSPLSIGHAPRYSTGGEGKISFEPRGSDWVFSAAVRFGRSNASKHLHQQSYDTKAPLHASIVPYHLVTGTFWRHAVPFMDTQRKDSESHTILDFQAGKDVGLGMLGTGSSSTLSLGVRYAQFGSRSNTAFKSDPDATPYYITLFGVIRYPAGATYHSNRANAEVARSFHGLGPTLSWNASTPLVGNSEDGEIALDWGVNVGVLFGRQKAHVEHQTTSLYHEGRYRKTNVSALYFRTTEYRNTPPHQARSHSVTVPNVGGFAGLSFHYSEAKVSFGYKVDWFFGAMDGGLDARRAEDIGFHGPYASISIGLGG